MRDPMDLNEPIAIEEGRSRKAARAPKKLQKKDEGGLSQRDKLIDCTADADLWHATDGIGYATLAVGDHAEHYLLRSKGFRLWLGYQYYWTYEGATGAQAMQDAIAALEAKARFEGDKHDLAVRIVHHGALAVGARIPLARWSPDYNVNGLYAGRSQL